MKFESIIKNKPFSFKSPCSEQPVEYWKNTHSNFEWVFWNKRNNSRFYTFLFVKMNEKENINQVFIHGH